VDNFGESVSSFVFCYIFDLPTQCQLPCSAVQVHNSITQLTWSSPAWAQHTQQLSLPSQCVAHYLCSHPRTGTAQHYIIDIPANLQAQPTITSPSYLPLLSPSSCHPTCVYHHHDPTILLVFIIFYSDTLYSVMFKLKLSVAHLYTAIPAQFHSCPRPLSPQ